MAQNKKKITASETVTHTDANGSVSRTSRQSFLTDSEDAYVKFYTEGLYYIRDMPRDCFALFCLLLDYCTYAGPNDKDGTNDSFHISLTNSRKKKLAKELGYKTVTAVSNLLTELIHGGAMIRLEKSVYRPNPFVCGRGSWDDMLTLRENGGFHTPNPDDTFMSVYNAKVEANRRVKEQKAMNEEARALAMAGYTVDPETCEAIPLNDGSTDILPHKGVPLLPVTE